MPKTRRDLAETGSASIYGTNVATLEVNTYSAFGIINVGLHSSEVSERDIFEQMPIPACEEEANEGL